MKKLYFLVATLFVAFAVNAHTLNNPVGEDGRYIVKWDCNAGTWAESNDFEIDETFTLAVDVTGTWLEDWLKDTPNTEGGSRGVAINHWTSAGDVNSDIRRLKQIKGNIYGAMFNLHSQILNDSLLAIVEQTDSVLYVSAQLFGFEYTADNNGAMWWQWDNNPIEETRADGADCLFATLPYTGTRTSPEFFGDDEGFPDMFGFGIAGYAAPCAMVETGLEDIVETWHFDVVRTEYFNILGQQISDLPHAGIYIKSMILSNGKRVNEKVIIK